MFFFCHRKTLKVNPCSENYYLLLWLKMTQAQKRLYLAVFTINPFSPFFLLLWKSLNVLKHHCRPIRVYPYFPYKLLTKTHFPPHKKCKSQSRHIVDNTQYADERNKITYCIWHDKTEIELKAKFMYTFSDVNIIFRWNIFTALFENRITKRTKYESQYGARRRRWCFFHSIQEIMRWKTHTKSKYPSSASIRNETHLFNITNLMQI